MPATACRPTPRRRVGWALLALLAIVLPRLGGAEAREVREVAPDWRFVTGGKIRHPPAASPEGTLYCVSDDRLLRAITADGTELWHAGLGARPACSPLVASDGGILVFTVDGAVQCFGAQGRRRWSGLLESSPVAAPACGRDGALFVPLSAGTLVALDYRGRARWSFRFKADIASSPSVGPDGSIYLCTADRLFHALSPEGSQRWAVSLPGNGEAPAVGGGGTVYVSAFGVHAFAPDGRLLWSFPVTEATTAPVVAPGGLAGAGELVVVGTRTGVVHLVNASGERVEQIELGSEVTQPAAIRDDGAIVVCTSDGMARLRAGRPGSTVALVRTKGPASAPVLSRGGRALVGSEDWVLYAATFGDERGPPVSAGQSPSWPQPRHDAQQSGRAPSAALEGRASALILGELASSPLLGQKEAVIQALRRHFDGLAYLPLGGGEIESLLLLLANEGVSSPVYVGEAQAGDYPELRIAACELLGELGTEGARRALIGVVERDPRGEVQSMAAASLGRVGYDPDGRSVAALERLASRRASDEGMLLAVVRALRGIASAGGPGLGLGNAIEGPEEPGSLASRPAWAALVSLAAGRYPERIRAAARVALSDLQAEIRR